ncbi:hypothetical protein GCM10017709_05750 [Glutamicibacter nicotianae]|uniref:Uncharacterized protein n=1 Tax=Glutamicibacter nicotianae TaxID=37929 RepID=A0ABQ0RMU1_GLUNI|nr:hypothetical protein ANI01nite_23290 [Glutamicibacter nicotianae]
MGSPRALTGRANDWSQAFPDLYKQSLAKVVLIVVPLDIVNSWISAYTPSDRVHDPTENGV